MATPITKKDQALHLLQEQGVATGNAFEAAGISRSYLYDLVKSGDIARVGRGLFSLQEQQISINHSLAEIAAYMPESIICLLSALQFHEIGTQLPPVVWIALKPHSYIPQCTPTAIQAVYMDQKYLDLGVETHLIDRVPVKITSIAKTVTDCFKHKRSVGLGVCLEALKDVLDNKRATADEIYYMALANRMAKKILPYLEALNWRF